MNNVLSKVIVAQFYKINTGFFLVLFVLLFGLLNGKATLQLHYGIMQSITSSYVYLAGAMVVWVLYSVKCISFSLKEIKNPANSFLFGMQAVSDKAQMLSLLLCQATLMLPMLVYGGITVFIGIGHGHYVLAALFAAFQLLLCVLGSLIYFRAINRTWVKPILTLPAYIINHKKRFLFYLLHYSVHARKRTFIGVKLLSLLLLQAMLAANEYEINQESVCVLIMFLISAHALLPYYYVQFMEVDLAFTRNMPISLMRRYGVYSFTYAIIFLPELLFLLINGYHTLQFGLIASLYVVAIAQLLLFTSLLHFKNINSERYLMLIFALFFGSLLFLASFNLWIFFPILLLFSIYIFIKNYYKYSSK